MRARGAALVAALLLAACTGGGPKPGPGPSTTSSPGTSSPGTSAPPTTAPSTTPPATGGFVAFGDFGGGAGQSGVAAQMERWAGGHAVGALVTTGDNVYPDGNPSLYASELDAPYATLRSSRPMWVTLGNHDVQAGYGADELRHLGLPDLPYTETLGDAQLLFVDANRPDQAQADWLDARLSEPGPRFRVVVFHQPAYACGPHGSTATVDQFWVPVLERHQVALVLNGHDHYYERFVSSGGVTYVVTGGGGQTLYSRSSTCSGTPPSQATAMRYHFTAVEIAGNTLTLTAVADDGTTLDRAVITR